MYTNMSIPTPLLAMIALVTIQVSIALVYKFSGTKGHYAFSPASALAMAELAKLIMSCCFHIRETRALSPDCCSVEPMLGTPAGYPLSKESSKRGISHCLQVAWNSARNQVTRRFVKHTAGLAFMYLCNNHLAFHLYLIADPGTISLFKSGSGLVSAIVLWCIARGIAVNQWICVLLQALGLALAQYDPCEDHARYSSGTYLFLLTTVLMTTLSGVWNEHLVKTHKVSLNVQNCCLYIFGFLFNVFGFMLRRTAGLDDKGFLEGYGSIGAVGVVVGNSVIGLAITAVYKYADVMVKQVGNVVSTSILIVLGLTLFGETTSFQSVIGCCVVFCATYLYFQSGASKPKSDPVQKSATEDGVNKLPSNQHVSWKKVLFRSFTALGSLSLVLIFLLSGGNSWHNLLADSDKI